MLRLYLHIPKAKKKKKNLLPLAMKLSSLTPHDSKQVSESRGLKQKKSTYLSVNCL